MAPLRRLPLGSQMALLACGGLALAAVLAALLSIWFEARTAALLSFATSARLDKDDLSLRRNDTSLRFNGDSFETEIIYTRIGAQPRYGLADTSSEIQGAAALKFHDYWSVFGSVTYDIGNHIVSRNGVGLSYDDRDTVFSIVYEQTRDKSSSQANDWSIGARLMFRTLGDIQIGDTTLTGFE